MVQSIVCSSFEALLDSIGLASSKYAVSFFSLGSYFRGCLGPTSKDRFPGSVLYLEAQDFAVSWYGMIIISGDMSHDPKAIVLDFSKFTLAPDAASKQCIASYSFIISVGLVRKMVTSSAYATTEVIARCRPNRRPRREFSRLHRSGFKHIAYRIML